jgi:hypothetical protein
MVSTSQASQHGAVAYLIKNCLRSPGFTWDAPAPRVLCEREFLDAA